MPEDGTADDPYTNALNFDTGQFRSIGYENAESFDDQNFRQPLPQEDRVWRHPSEVVTEAPPTATSKTTLAVVALAGSLLGAGIAVGAVLWLRPVSETIVERRIEPSGIATSQNAASSVPDVITVAETVRPAIVRVDIQGPEGFSSGSGVIFRSDGYLLTNAHVVKDADNVQITTQEGETYAAEVIGEDPRTDIAVVKVDMDDAPVALLGSAEGLKVGQWAITIGSPLALAGGNTVTLGVISALERELTPSGSQNRLYDLIQTDALIAPGSSGGALLDGDGAVIGITTAVAVSDLGADGVGFAVPIDIASRVANELIENGEVRHAWIGITGGDPSEATLTELQISGGVQIESVLEDGPAAELAIDSGDIIIGINGQDVESMTELILRLRDMRSGEVVDLNYVTPGGSNVTESIQLGTRPGEDELVQLNDDQSTTTQPDTTTTG